MENQNTRRVTATTEVTPTGQKCTGVVITYDREVGGAAVDAGCYEVKDRNIVSARADGAAVTLTLSPEDAAAALYCAGNPWQGTKSSLKDARLLVRQKRELLAADGTYLPAFDFVGNDSVKNELVDDFIQCERDGQKYSLFIPRDYDPSVKYPLVQFIHDAGPCGGDARLTLAQGLGAVIWATEEEQEKHPCFVYAPQFDSPPIVNDDWEVDARLETAKAVLDSITEEYNIDKSRIYTTGQSMGCMSSIVLNVRYPQYFAASFLVAGQWDERAIEGLERQHIWMLNSQGDAKSFPIMNQMCVEMEKRGAKIAHRVMDAGLSQEEYRRIAGELEATGANIIHTSYRLETVADGWHSNGGEHHTHTWRTAYQIEAIRDWLFTNQTGT